MKVLNVTNSKEAHKALEGLKVIVDPAMDNNVNNKDIHEPLSAAIYLLGLNQIMANPLLSMALDEIASLSQQYVALGMILQANPHALDEWFSQQPTK